MKIIAGCVGAIGWLWAAANSAPALWQLGHRFDAVMVFVALLAIAFDCVNGAIAKKRG